MATAANESDRLERRKNLMVYTNRITIPNTKISSVPLSYDIYNSLRVGEVESVVLEVNGGTPGIYNLTNEVLRAFGLVLRYAAEGNLGPTRSSRLYYLWFFAVAAAYQRVDVKPRVIGTKDAWNWDARASHGAWTEKDQCIWMLMVLEKVFLKFGISYTAPWSALRVTYLLSTEALSIAKADVAEAGGFRDWCVALDIWWNYRAGDGNVPAATPPASAMLPNEVVYLQVDATDDPATFPRPESWTPLKLSAGSNGQKYLTYNWNNVVSGGGLTADDQRTVFEAADALYPGVGTARDAEIAEVVAITNELTDTQKVIAEFWAGGPFTVSPPGMLLWMWSKYMTGREPATVLYSGLDLSLHLFETGRIVWGLKKAHMEARPIQEIRRLYHGVILKKYDGTDILGESWVPYQETNFVTPPFADFPSGHSAFSRSFANVMNRWFGAAIEGVPVVMDDISLISPALVAQSGSFGSFVFEAGASQIQSGVVPAEAITLSWSTWDEMAESAGVSRKYGGIHATSAHTGSVAAANALHAVLGERFAIRT